MTGSYRCVNEGCGRTFPRAVAFCPYCGTRQGAGAMPPAPAAAAAPAPAPATPPAAPVPPPAARPEPVAPPPARAGAPRPGPAAAPRYRQPEPAAGVPRPPSGGAAAPALPPPRKPVGKATWLLVALLLLAIWFLVKPGDPARKLDKRVDDAVALTKECRIADARDELASLRADNASAAQLERLQKAIGATATACEKKTQRAKAWSDTRAQLETGVAAGALGQASNRLAAFVKKWGEDDDTRGWRERIDTRRADKLLDEANACLQKKDRACVESKLDAAEKLRRPEAQPRIEALRESLSKLLESTLLEQGGQAAAPAPLRLQTAAIEPGPGTDAREAARLQAEAEHELAQGNYRGAMTRAAQCAQLGGTGCAALRERAARLDREFQACVKAGRGWAGERCQ